MANDLQVGITDRLDPSLTQLPVEKEDPKNGAQVNKDEFLQLLVVQLQNQDPLDPMKNEDFAVNLAQFSQLEQLVDINNKIGAEKETGTDISSLASYLGHNVALNTDSIEVESGNGGSIKFKLDNTSPNVKLDLLAADGSIVKTVSLGQFDKGTHVVDLENLGVSSGNYGFNVKALNPAGFEQTLDAKVAGIVSGFVPGAEPKLLVGSKEVTPGDIAEVFVAE